MTSKCFNTFNLKGSMIEIILNIWALDDEKNEYDEICQKLIFQNQIRMNRLKININKSWNQ
jgi:hypothetical protein